MNNDFIQYLKNNEPECHLRLCECRNKPSDVILMANVCHEYNPDKTPKECFEYVFEWVTDWNSQLEVADAIYPKWDWYLSRVH